MTETEIEEKLAELENEVAKIEEALKTVDKEDEEVLKDLAARMVTALGETYILMAQKMAQ